MIDRDYPHQVALPADTSNCTIGRLRISSTVARERRAGILSFTTTPADGLRLQCLPWLTPVGPRKIGLRGALLALVR
jgi:hypothetical protein